MTHSALTRTTTGRGRLFDSILDTVGDTPGIRINNLAGPRQDLRQGRVLQSGRLGQGPAGAQHHRGGRARRHAEARPDRGRGDQRQHRHRARHGLRAEGLSAGRHHGRQLLDRAPQADAHARRQGRADAARPEGLRHVPEGGRAGRGQWLVPGAPVRDRGQRRHPRGDDRRARSSTTSPASGSTISSPATAPAARWPASRACCGRSGRRPRSSSASRPTPSWSAAARRRSAAPTARRRAATRPSSRIRSRAGRRTSSRCVLQEAIDKHYYDELIPIAGAEGMKWAQGAGAEGRHLHRRLRRLDLRRGACRSPRRRRPGSVILCMLPDTGERYLTTPLFEGIEAEMNDGGDRPVPLDAGIPVPGRVT